MSGIGLYELICLAVFGLMGVAAVIAVTLVLLRASQEAPGEPAKALPMGPPPVLADAVSHIDVVAKIAKRFCPKCRAVLTSDSPEGLCPACLLAGGLSDVSPVDPSSPSVDSSDKPPPAEVAQLLAELPNLEIL